MNLSVLLIGLGNIGFLYDEHNKNTNSISYNKKKIQINMNCIGSLITFCVIGLKPHS